MTSEDVTSSASGTGTARRVDPETGVEEVVEFFGEGPARMLGIRYTPTRNHPSTGVVICEPLFAQFVAHYRYGTVLARRLAASGLVVQRFHYRGSGNSDAATLTLDSISGDTLEAAALLEGKSGVEDVAFFGIQVGAYPAARASSDGSALVLDSPPPSGRLYLRGAFRAHIVTLMSEGGTPPSQDDLVSELETEGGVALLGSRLPLSFYESIEDRGLIDEIGTKPRRVLLIGAGREGQLRPALDGVRTELDSLEFPVDTVVLKHEDPFWYVEHSAPEEQPEARQTAVAIGNWLHSEHTELGRTASESLG